MKKILFFLLLIVGSMSVKAQFPTTDSLRAFINRFIRNSAVESFQNLRLNTALIGMTNYLDSAYGGQVVSFTAPNDSTARIITLLGDTLSVTIRGVGGVTNGDKGDIVVSGGGGTWTIDNNVVTFSKFQQVSGLSIVGNSTNSTANTSTITASSDNQVLRRSGTTLGFGAVNLASSNAVIGVLPLGNVDTSSTNHVITRAQLDHHNIDVALRLGNIDTLTALQFGYPDTGFVQTNDGINHAGIPMVLLPYTYTDTNLVTPRRVDIFKTSTNHYDDGQPLNTITEIAKFGSNNLSDHYFRIAFEQNWFGGGEYHGWEYKLDGIGAAIRGHSATWNWKIPDLSTTTFRAGQFAFQPTLSDTQMIFSTPNATKITNFRAAVPEFSIAQLSTDGTKGGLYLNTQDNQTYVNWHYGTSNPNNHTLILDWPGTVIAGCYRSSASDAPEQDIRFADLASNRFIQWKRGTKIMMTMNSDVGGLTHSVYGGEYTAQMSNILNVKTYRSNNQKPFGVAITNAADSILSAPISTDTLGNVVINIPLANDAWQDGLLFDTRTERFRVYGESYFSDTITAQVMDSTASPANMVWRDPVTKQLKLAAVPGGGTSDLTGGAIKTNIHIVNDADYTVASTDYIILYKTMTAGRTLTLPSAASSTNRMLIIKNGGAGSFNITTSISYRENSSTTGTTIGTSQSMGLCSDGTDWWVVWVQ